MEGVKLGVVETVLIFLDLPRRPSHLFCLFLSQEELEDRAPSPFPHEGRRRRDRCVSSTQTVFSKCWLEGRVELALKRYFPGKTAEADRYRKGMAHPFPTGWVTGGQSEILYSCPCQPRPGMSCKAAWEEDKEL